MIVYFLAKWPDERIIPGEIVSGSFACAFWVLVGLCHILPILCFYKDLPFVPILLLLFCLLRILLVRFSDIYSPKVNQPNALWIFR